MHNKAIKWLWRHYNITLDNVSVKVIITLVTRDSEAEVTQC